MSDSVTGQTVVDPREYLSSLTSIKLSTDAEVGDIKKVHTAQSGRPAAPRQPRARARR